MKLGRFKIALVGLAAAGCSQSGPPTVYDTMPRGRIALGRTILLDDGKCPTGQITQVVGQGTGKTPKRSCVARSPD